VRAAARERRLGLLLSSPAAAAVLLFALAPLAVTAWLSLRRHMPVFGISRFVGLANYRFLASDPRFLGSLAVTLHVVVLAVTLEVLLGLGFALLANAELPGRGLVRALLFVPWALPTVVAASVWRWILDPSYGLLRDVLAHGTNWLGDPRLALDAIVLVDVWKCTPFAALLFLAALQLVPRDLLRAARVDGAGRVRTFLHVTLPLLAPTVLVVVLFRSLDVFRIFDVVWVLTGGGPADTTETVSVYAYDLYFQTLQFGYGSAVTTAAFAAMLLWATPFSAAFLRRSGR